MAQTEVPLVSYDEGKREVIGTAKVNPDGTADIRLNDTEASIKYQRFYLNTSSGHYSLRGTKDWSIGSMLPHNDTKDT